MRYLEMQKPPFVSPTRACCVVGVECFRCVRLLVHLACFCRGGGFCPRSRRVFCVVGRDGIVLKVWGAVWWPQAAGFDRGGVKFRAAEGRAAPPRCEMHPSETLRKRHEVPWVVPGHAPQLAVGQGGAFWLVSTYGGGAPAWARQQPRTERSPTRCPIAGAYWRRGRGAHSPPARLGVWLSETLWRAKPLPPDSARLPLAVNSTRPRAYVSGHAADGRTWPRAAWVGLCASVSK